VVAWSRSLIVRYGGTALGHASSRFGGLYGLESAGERQRRVVLVSSDVRCTNLASGSDVGKCGAVAVLGLLVEGAQT
jgi:hypothetical protein